jgi:hypothetical protein
LFCEIVIFYIEHITNIADSPIDAREPTLTRYLAYVSSSFLFLSKNRPPDIRTDGFKDTQHNTTKLFTSPGNNSQPVQTSRVLLPQRADTFGNTMLGGDSTLEIDGEDCIADSSTPEPFGIKREEIRLASGGRTTTFE